MFGHMYEHISYNYNMFMNIYTFIYLYILYLYSSRTSYYDIKIISK